MMETEEKKGSAGRSRSMPNLRFPEFKDSWAITRLGDIAKFSKGKGVSKSDIAEDGLNKCIRYGELYTVYSEKIDKIVSKTNLSKSESVLSEANDVIIPASGETPLDIATASCVLQSGIILGGDLNIIKTNSEGVFLSYYLNNRKKRDIASLSQGNSVVHLYSKQLSSLILNIPKIEEQQRIASFLSTVDEKINKLQRKKELLQAYKKGLMQQLFSQQLRFKNEDGNDFPEWEEKKLGKVGEIVNGLTYSPNDIDDNGVIVLRSSNVKKRRIDLEDQVRVSVEKYNPVKTGDILICVRNGSKRLIGKNALIRNKDENLAFGAFMSVFRSGYNEFIFHLFGSDIYKKQVYQNLGATINSINGSDLKKFKIPFPSKEEQAKIATFLSALDAKIDTVSTAITQIQDFKKGLLQQMFV